MPIFNNETILVAVVAVIGLAILLQTILLLAIFFAVRKTARTLRESAEELRSTVVPIAQLVRDTIVRLAPKIEGAADDLAKVAQTLRVQSTELHLSTNEIMEKLRHQSVRMDAMITSFLDAADRAGGFVIESVGKPVRQISGLIASVKAVVETLRFPKLKRQQPHPTSSESI